MFISKKTNFIYADIFKYIFLIMYIEKVFSVRECFIFCEIEFNNAGCLTYNPPRLSFLADYKGVFKSVTNA